jgi:hypothetical protein
MDTLKEIVSFLGAVVGFLTALVTLYALYVDRKNRREAEGARPAPELSSPPPLPRWQAATDSTQSAVALLDALPAYEETTDRARQLVRAPAITLICLGVLSLGFNLFFAAYGFVDEFVTPLDPSKQQQVSGPYGGRPAGAAFPDRATAGMSIVTLLSFAVASVIAIGAGFSMVRLRGYWLSVVGTCAILPAACFCCFAGLPVGVWGFVVLMKPEVSSAFT